MEPGIRAVLQISDTSKSWLAALVTPNRSGPRKG